MNKKLAIILGLGLTLQMSAAEKNLLPSSKFSPRTLTFKEAFVKEVKNDTIISAYIKVDQKALDYDALEDLGVKVGTCAAGYATVRLPLSAINSISEVEGVEWVDLSTEVKQMLNVASPQIGIDKVRAGQDGLTQGYDGTGVIIGIIDSGFDYTHMAFRDAEGNLRIKRVWEQHAQATDTRPAPEQFGYGSEMTDPEDILAAGGDIMNNSHGTHVTAIAAGSDSFMDGALMGMAPGADIVLVSMTQAGNNNVNISNAISYIFDYADSVGKPCVINMSLGNQAGPHDGTSVFDVMADSFAGPGRLLIGAAGNSRGEFFHLNKTFTGADDTPLQSFIDFKNGFSADKVKGDIEVWAKDDVKFQVSLICYNTRKNEVTEEVVVYPSDEATQTVSLGRNISGSLSVSSEISPLNGKQHIFITNGVTGVRANYQVAIRVTPLSAGMVDVWADNINVGFNSHDKADFSQQTPASTLCEIGGTANRILTVGAFTSRNKFSLINEDKVIEAGGALGSLCDFSGNGPTADGRIKPQVSAPGCMIASAVSSNDYSGLLQYAFSNEIDGVYYMYGYMQGTSMATPFVTGTVATWLQAYPTLNPEELVEIIQNTTNKDSFTGPLTNGDSDWGYGKLNALAGIKECIAKNETGGIHGAVADEHTNHIVYNRGQLSVVFSQSYDKAEINVFGATGVKMLSRTLRNVSVADQVNLDLSGLAKGIYIVSVDTPSGRQVLKINR